MDERDRIVDILDLNEMCAAGFLPVKGPLGIRTAFEGEAGSPEKTQRRVIIMMCPQGSQDLVQDDQIRRKGDKQGLEEAVVHMDFTVFQLQNTAERG